MKPAYFLNGRGNCLRACGPSVSAKGGRIIHISVRGDSPLFDEVLNNPLTATAIFEAPADCELDDRAAWASANPGLGTIKALAYMKRKRPALSTYPAMNRVSGPMI